MDIENPPDTNDNELQSVPEVPKKEIQRSKLSTPNLLSIWGLVFAALGVYLAIKSNELNETMLKISQHSDSLSTVQTNIANIQFEISKKQDSTAQALQEFTHLLGKTDTLMLLTSADLESLSQLNWILNEQMSELVTQTSIQVDQRYDQSAAEIKVGFEKLNLDIKLYNEFFDDVVLRWTAIVHSGPPLHYNAKREMVRLLQLQRKKMDEMSFPASSNDSSYKDIWSDVSSSVDSLIDHVIIQETMELAYNLAPGTLLDLNFEQCKRLNRMNKNLIIVHRKHIKFIAESLSRKLDELK